jgi:AraC-like DNA-binding protein
MRSQEWRFETARDVVVRVPPDGCRDVIGRRESDGRMRWFLFPLASGVETAHVPAGSSSRGFRLSPGAILDPRLPAALAELDLDDPRVEERAMDHARLDPAVADALAALRGAASAQAAARSLGVGLRRLERMTAPSGAPPRFWLGLARARRAARALTAREAPLAEIALAQGYCDQAHLSRAMARWFARSPAALARDAEFARAIGQSGYE